MASHQILNEKVIDYSLYLVTGRDLLPPGKSYLESLEQSLKGGVKIVQIREKSVDTAEFLKVARESQILCKKYKVPILINDRIDIALAMHADGVHLGQTDMPVSIARGLLPKGSIIGVSCNNVDEIKAAIKDRVDYVGIGAVWGTKTKELTSPIVSVRGVGEMLNHLNGTHIKAVAIGGIKATNLLRTLHGSVSTSGRALDGIAVVSDIVGSKDPLDASRRLCDIFREFRNALPTSVASHHPYTPDYIKASASRLLEDLKLINPLVQQITNIVVANQSANATLALGASPIMASAPEEMEDLSHVIGSLLVNFGTIKDKEGMLVGGHHANLNKKPVIFDPVGVGATRFRRAAADELLNTWQASVIKGNAGELAALAKSDEVKAKGVDSVGTGFADPGRFVKQLALTERCVVVMTGPTDWISDGVTVVRLDNGNKLLADITGSGCMVGTCVAVFCAAAASSAVQRFEGKLVSGDMLCGAVAGVLALTIASELAAARSDVRGTGTFLPALIDELYNLTAAKIQQYAKIEVVG
ncbi:TMP-TENI-domain-containing protein [Athelia psychrophila]|uniref:TMP-TENI-domain-containing protein n=1 Tax=Athelia psychrophila TaxID=1759441 RepID=A0A166GLL7_9AGAM|nr:TMP-TENI-domain-containing protein [Fibularhizoctonia sp. CBS 109695]